MIRAQADPRLWYLTLFLIVAAGAVAIPWAYRVWRDVKGEVEEPSTDPDDLLAPLAEAFAAGQMSEEEYHRIRESIRRGSGAGEAPALPRKPPPRSDDPG